MASGPAEAPVSPDAEALLTRFKPQLRYDSQEAFFADSAAEMTDNPGNQLRRAPGADGSSGKVIAAVGYVGEPKLSLSFLGSPNYSNDETVADTDRIGISGTDYRTQYVRLRTSKDALKNLMYGHARTDSDGRLWLQYWFWYFYNDYHLAGDFGLHEGDWEMVQLRMHGDRPDLAVYAQHRQAEKRAWQEVNHPDGKPDTPLVYPGRGSHASYFEAGLYETEAWFDIADGRRKTPELRLETVQDDEPPWIAWPGMWGDTEPRVQGLEQPSPTGPSRHRQWTDPKVLFDTAVTRPPKKPPQPPEVSAARGRDGLLHVAYDFTRRSGPRPAKLIVTVNSVNEKGVPPRTFDFDVAGSETGELRTGLALRADWHYDVYTSVTSVDDGKGVPSESTLTELDPGPRPQGLPADALQVVKRAVFAVSQFVRGLFHRSGGGEPRP